MFSRIKTERTKIISFGREHKRLLSIVVTVIFSSYFLFFLIFSDLGLIKYITMRGEYNRIKNDISRLKTENKGLREDVEALKTDPDYIEALAREGLGLVKEGEIIYKFEDKDREK